MTTPAFEPLEWHHGHLGVLLIIAGLWLGPWCWVPGVVLAVEDYVWQHALGMPSPFKWLYGVTLYRIAAVRRLNVWLDNLVRFTFTE